MAVNMSQKDKDALAAAGAAWNEANARGDEAGKAAAHAQAEAIRNNYGYSGGGDGSSYIPTEGGLIGYSQSSRPSYSSGGSSGRGSSSGNSYGMPDSPEMGFMSPDDYNDLKAAGAAYLNAKTDAERKAAHAQAEAIRARYMYSGGDAGDQILALDQFPYNPYQNQYQEQIDEILDSILNRDPFSYNYLDDPLYQQYQQAYRREGDRAMQDAIGQVAARTGGLASSYAASAANQANNYYMAQLGDKIPELQQLAYSMYVDDRNYDTQKLQVLEDLEQLNYGRWNDDLTFRYGIYRDNVSDSRYDDETSWERNQYESETEYERALQRAETLAQFGNFSGYRELGYSDAEITQMETAYKQAQVQSYSSGSRSGSSGGSSGGSSSSSSDTDYDGLFAAARASGYPKSYIANHYKEFGFKSSSGLYDEYQGWETGVSEVENAELDLAQATKLIGEPVSSDKLADMEELGLIERYIQDGYIRFKWADNDAARRYYEMRGGNASISDNIPSFGGFPHIGI